MISPKKRVEDLKPEEAYYFKILLQSGLEEEYDAWLNIHWETENPWSDLLVDLSDCGRDINQTISVLQRYCENQEIDEQYIQEKLRTFLKEGYYSNRFSKKETIFYMYRFITAHEEPGVLETSLWNDMYYVYYYYNLVEDGVVSEEKFHNAFLSYLEYGTPIDSDQLWCRSEPMCETGIRMAKNIVYILLQSTWGILQTLLGGLLFLLHLSSPHRFYHGAVVTEWNAKSSISLGLFIFVTREPYFYEKLKDQYTKEDLSERLLVHEYGHTIQSLILGPLYVIVMGVPSTLWGFLPYYANQRKQGRSYFSFFTERWANYLGEKATNESAMEQLQID